LIPKQYNRQRTPINNERYNTHCIRSNTQECINMSIFKRLDKLCRHKHSEKEMCKRR